MNLHELLENKAKVNSDRLAEIQVPIKKAPSGTQPSRQDGRMRGCALQLLTITKVGLSVIGNPEREHH